MLVELGTKASGAGGRPAVALGLAPQGGSLVGIHLGHADLRVVLTSLDGTVLMQQRHFLSRNGLTPTVDDNEAAPRGAIWARTPSRPRTTARVQEVRGSQLATTGSPSRTAQRPRPPARTPRTRMTRALADGQPKDAPRTNPLRFGLAAPTATTHRETKSCAYVGKLVTLRRACKSQLLCPRFCLSGLIARPCVVRLRWTPSRLVRAEPMTP